MDDLKTILGKSRGLSPAQANAVRNDFAAISAVGHQPDAQAVASLRADLAQAAAVGRLSSNLKTKVSQDFSAVLKSSGVAPGLVHRSSQDLNAVLHSPDLAPADLKTLIEDLLSVLSARPSASSSGSATPALRSGLGAWFVGGKPIGS